MTDPVIIGDATLYLGDCLEVLPTLAAGSVDAVVTDPPYGCNKAEWDAAFPMAWYTEAKRIARMVVVITGSCGLKDTVPLVGDDFVDVISARNMNGMTRGPIGYGNWIAAVIACGKPKRGQNVLQFSVAGQMPDHPSPKPIEYMQRLIERVTEQGQTVLDCFLGSGTTGVACAQLGRRFIGVEIEPKYFDIACKRIEAAQMQLRMAL
jgi:site-specific DNA-methyltransferase (adenine-specific)